MSCKIFAKSDPGPGHSKLLNLTKSKSSSFNMYDFLKISDDNFL